MEIQNRQQREKVLKELTRQIPSVLDQLDDPQGQLHQLNMLEAVLNFKVTHHQSRMLFQIAPYLHNSLIQQKLIDSICKFDDKDYVAFLLCKLIKLLPTLSDSLKQRILKSAHDKALSIETDSWLFMEIRIKLISEMSSISRRKVYIPRDFI